jgi:hypothetical protein
MKHTHMVIHWSKNYINDPFIKYCTEKEANDYVKTFQTQSKEHKDDTISIVSIVSEHKVSEIDHGIFGVKQKSIKS